MKTLLMPMSPSSPPPGARTHATSLVALMLLAVAAVAALAFWDHQRESAAALDDFAREQATLAGSVASELATRLAAVRRDDPAPPPATLLEGAARVERPGAARILLLGPDGQTLRGTDGSEVACDDVERALAAGDGSVWLSRETAASLGLPPRRAAAGLGRVDAGALGKWGIAVVVSAERVRDREQRALVRLALGVLVAAGLVFLFGTAALKKQREGLLLERELALEALGRQRDAELAAASRAATMGTLAMGIAHEVSTPLGIIAGRGEQLLARTSGDERASRAAQAILEQTERIRTTIRGFLDLVRGEEPALGDIDPAAVIDGAVALVAHRFATAGVTLAQDVAPDLPAIHGDLPMLEQAVVNLLLNACDASGRGGHVQVKALRDGARLAFTVRDDGPGIAPADAARAMEPFFTTKPRGQGTGLGLAIANEIVKLHRGELRLAPVTSRGTCASIILPIPAAVSHAA
jgi:signal transduction histidine kinase